MELFEISENPQPADAHVGSVVTPDGFTLRYARWLPSASASRGTVTILQGRGEFIEKYYELVGDLRGRGFAVAAFDWRGQGRSQRLLDNCNFGHVESFMDYVVDLETVFKEIILPDSPAPHFVIAHSTGGAILLLAADRFQSRLDRVVLTSPLVNLRLSDSIFHYPFKLVPLLKLLGMKNRPVRRPRKLAFQNLPFEENVLTSDPVRYSKICKILDTYPELALSGPTIGWLSASQLAMSTLNKSDFGSSVRLPILFVAAGKDQVVSNSRMEKLATRLPLAKYMEINGSKHEIMFERDVIRQQFLAAFDAFMP